MSDGPEDPGSRRRAHWDAVYAAKPPEGVSWYRAHLDRSLGFVEAAGLSPSSRIVDVGGGASTFVDDLLDRGYQNVTVLDVSENGLRASRERLGARESRVQWIRGDVTEVDLPEGAFDFWHDRAVFHFLRDPDARARYVKSARRSLKPGGWIMLAAFGPDGPLKCSGLEVVRFAPQALHAELGAGFELESSATEVHVTPWGAEQGFVYCLCRRRG